MKRPSLLAGLLLLLVLWFGCKDPKKEVYDPPSWLSGKIYDQLASRADLSTFKACVDRHSEYKEILAKTNLLTVFAPNNAAFEAFFANHPTANQVSELSRSEVRGIVENHIIFYAWNTDQLTQTDDQGKIDPDNPDRNEATAFKRITAYQDSIYEINVIDDDVQPKVVRNGGTSTRLVHNDGFKYIPIFFSDYLKNNDLTPDDYTFYYNVPFDPTTLYYAGARLIPEESNIPAENGFIHVIDKVVPPVPNLEQRLLQSEGQSNSYIKYLDLVRSFPYLYYDQNKTEDQPGYDQGTADDIFQVWYRPDYVPIEIGIEKIYRSIGTNGDATTVLHSTMMAPTDQAFDKLIDQITGYPNWKNYDELPDEVLQIIIKSYMRYEATYHSDIVKGIQNIEGDSVFGGFGTISESNIVDKQFCSNGMFLGLNEPIVPRAFSSVAGPVYLRPQYDLYRQLCEEMGILATLKNTTQEYTFCVIDDNTFETDSFLTVEEKVVQRPGGYREVRKSFQYYDRREDPPTMKDYTRDDMGLVMNMIMEGRPTGNANVEFVKTLAGNYATYQKDNQGRTVLSGTDASLRGISSNDTIVYPIPLDDFEADNGTVQKVSAFLNFSSVSRLFGQVKSMGAGIKTTDQKTILKYGFYDLLVVAGLVDEVRSEFTFTVDGYFYTVFIPPYDVLEKYEEIEGIKLHELPKQELAQFLKYHFVQGALLFTDGKAMSGKYKTMRLSETSTPFNKVYSEVQIASEPDNLQVLDKNGLSYISIKPVKGKTNVMTFNSSASSSEESLYIPHYTSGIIHTVNQVLVYE